MRIQESETLRDLMRAFAGESQARARYSYAASVCRAQELHALGAVFGFTARQEREHAEIFWRHMAPVSGQKVTIQGDFPVETSDDVCELLRRARDDEREEAERIYPAFAAAARDEGFPEIASSFERIAQIERAHGSRFGAFLDLLEAGRLFAGDAPSGWLCLNCGHIHQGTDAPQTCPVCSHAQGHFIRLEMAPYGGPGVLC